MYEEVGFDIHPPVVETQIGEHQVRLCHLPIVGDSQDSDRFATQRPTIDDGGWLLHGHVHERWKVAGRQINVSVDV